MFPLGCLMKIYLVFILSIVSFLYIFVCDSLSKQAKKKHRNYGICNVKKERMLKYEHDFG